MSNQLSFFEPDENEQIKAAIEQELRDVLSRNGLSELPIQFETIKQKACSYSVKFYDSVIVRVYKGKKKIYIELPNVGKLRDDSKKGKADFIKIYLSSLKDVSEHFDKITYSLQYILDRLPKDFSCCSRYESCSDAKSCIHPNKEFALGCYYRKVLSSGRIFYGKNRNID